MQACFMVMANHGARGRARQAKFRRPSGARLLDVSATRNDHAKWAQAPYSVLTASVG